MNLKDLIMLSYEISMKGTPSAPLLTLTDFCAILIHSLLLLSLFNACCYYIEHIFLFTVQCLYFI